MLLNLVVDRNIVETLPYRLLLVVPAFAQDGAGEGHHPARWHLVEPGTCGRERRAGRGGGGGTGAEKGLRGGD